MDDSVLKAAVTWWRSKRPAHYRLTDHLKHPRVGCSTVEERDLARAVAEHERARIISVIRLAEQRRRGA